MLGRSSDVPPAEAAPPEYAPAETTAPDYAAAETTAPEHAPAVPQPGTAAERAAARRARLRAEASARKGGE